MRWISSDIARTAKKTSEQNHENGMAAIFAGHCGCVRDAGL
jgi:hypothetical protein